MTRGRARRYLLTQQGYYPQVVADAGYTVFDWSTLNAGTLFQDSAKTTPASANGDVIGCWTDGVGGVDATQVTTANKPGLATASLGTLPTLSFDGGDLLETGNISISTFAVWIVYNITGGSVMLYEHGTTATSDGAYMLSSSMNVYRTPLRDNKSMSTVANTDLIARHEHGGTSVSHKLYNNNSLVATTNVISNDVGTATATKSLYIGARSGVSLAMTGKIGQLLIMSPYPTDTSILVNMESYINNIWGVY